MNSFSFLKRKTQSTSTSDNDLTSAKFRILNEKLYTMSSKDAFDYFTANTDDFETYHKGFATQVQKWPMNPNDLIIKSLKQKKYKTKVIADIGCGEGKLGQTLLPLGYTVYSYDLVSMHPHVVCADMKNLPLDNHCVDVAVFCLSLMNKNFVPFVVEANRILKMKGRLVVAEITSRIVDKKEFVNVCEKVGFKLIKDVDLKGFFVVMTFKKIKEKNNNKNIMLMNKDDTYDILKPCLYKKR